VSREHAHADPLDDLPDAGEVILIGHGSVIRGRACGFLHPVIPGRAEGASLESIITVGEYPAWTVVMDSG
jgi:hypothetical protein